MSLPENFDFHPEFAKCKTAEELIGKNGFIQRLIGGMLEQMLQKEMDEHLRYAQHLPRSSSSSNTRNGTSKKKLKSNFGEVELQIPRDRHGDFEPVAEKAPALHKLI